MLMRQSDNVFNVIFTLAQICKLNNIFPLSLNQGGQYRKQWNWFGSVR